MPTVHSFRVRNHSAGTTVEQPPKATETYIRNLGGEIISGTAEEVQASDIDGEGRYVAASTRAPTQSDSAASPSGLRGYGQGIYGQEPYGGGGYGVAGGYGMPPADQGSFDRAAFDPSTFQTAPAPIPVATGEVGGGRLADVRVELPGVSANGEPAPFVPDQSKSADAVRIDAEHRRNQGAAVIDSATSGQTEPVSPVPAGTVLVSPTPEAGAAPTMDRLAVPAVEAGVARTPAASSIVLDFTRNREVISISAAAFMSLLDIRIEQLAEELRQKNDPDAIDKIRQELAQYGALKQRTLLLQQVAVRFAEEPATQGEVVAASISFAEGIKNWWNEKHVSICDSSFKTSLFLAGAGVSYALGIPLLGAGVCGVLIGGEPVGKVLATLYGKGK